MGFFSAVKRFFGSKAPGAAGAEQDTARDAQTVNKPEAERGAASAQATPALKEDQDCRPPLPDQPSFLPLEPEITAQPLERGVENLPEEAARQADHDEEGATAQTASLQHKEGAPAPMRERPPEPALAVPEASPPESSGAENISNPAPVSDGASIKAEQSQQACGSEDELILRLRQAEPRLSSWLEIILEGQDETNAEFWNRLRFFLRSLEAPETEIETFVSDFETWLKRMEYSHVDEFRSELQYRLALALDMEDEEDERNRLMLKLSRGLAATREHLGRQLDSLLANHGELTDSFWNEMEEMFIMADLGYEASLEIVERLKRRAAQQKASAAAEARQLLMDELEEIFRQPARIRAVNKPEVILMMGVNGAGKTTTIAKLAHRARLEGKKPLVVAADTFRAAAIEQLQVWAERAGAEFYAKAAGSDPASVAWEAMDYAKDHGIDVIFVDTAGRLQTKVNLMEELGKIRQVLAKKQPGAPHRSLLVLDATTGQNALSQAKLFKEAAGADEIALTKLDGTAKGGVAIAVAMRENLPISYVGLGEKMEDLRPFNGRDFAKALLERAA